VENEFLLFLTDTSVELGLLLFLFVSLVDITGLLLYRNASSVGLGLLLFLSESSGETEFLLLLTDSSVELVLFESSVDTVEIEVLWLLTDSSAGLCLVSFLTNTFPSCSAVMAGSVSLQKQSSRPGIGERDRR